MKEIKAIVRETISHQVVEALHDLPHFPGFTISECRGQGRGKGQGGAYQPDADVLRITAYVRLEVFCSDQQVDDIVRAIHQTGRTGRPGDGIIMVADLPRVVRISTGEEGDEAL